jgi:hypothetical protein
MNSPPAAEKPNRIPQIYGYTVCLIAVVAFLISINGIVDASFTLVNPLHSPYGRRAELSSFESYEAMHVERAAPNTPLDTSSEATRRRRFEALRADHIAGTRVDAIRQLVGRGLTLLIAIVLFAWHWRWLRARHAEERAAA